MSKSWSASVVVHIGSLSQDEIDKNPKRYERYFKDLKAPTEKELERYFEWEQENLAGSNTGSEALANAYLDIVTDEEE